MLQGTALVTGSSGFIGQKFIDALLKEDLTVHCLMRNPAAAGRTENPRLKIIRGDITNKQSLAGFDTAYDYVFHLAGHLSGGNERVFHEVNVQGSRNLYEAIADLDYAPQRIIHVSSMAAGGPAAGPAAKTESQLAAPVSLYGRTKLAGEQVAREFMHKLPITIIRPSVVYGPNDRNAVSIYKMVEKNFVLTPPKQPKYYSMVHVDDLAKIILKLAGTGQAAGEVFNIACGLPCSWDAFIAIVAESLHRQPRSINGSKALFTMVAFANHLKSTVLRSKADILTPQKLPELYAQYWIVDTSKLEAVIGEFNSVALQDGIQETANWYKANHWI